MKKLLFIASLVSTTIMFGQNQMTIAHSGISPSSTLTVTVGEDIEFIHGGGGSHPMTEGWQSGEASTPIVFVTQTVTSSNPTVTFTIDTPGTYYFHCGTNPGNQNNWGKIIVEAESGGNVSVNENVEITEVFGIYPNPSNKHIIAKGVTGTVEIFNLIGEKVLESTEKTINIESLKKGTYFVVNNGKTTKLIKY